MTPSLSAFEADTLKDAVREERAGRAGCALGVPGWAIEMLGASAELARPSDDEGADDFVVESISSDRAALVSVVLPGARAFSARLLRDRTRKAYELIRAQIGDDRHAVRLWNFIPGITEPMGESGASLDRYMAFNLGRHDAMERWYAGDLAGQLPAATGVGHAGDDLEVHALALDRAPLPVENPRQRPAFRYSQRFGPKPPCFARASVVTYEGERRLIIAGTASILGEESLHEGSLCAQLNETFENLRALIGSVRSDAGDPLRLLRHARAYSPDASGDEVIRESIGEAVGAGDVELLRADLCRKELLVEIEGVVDLPVKDAS